MPSSVLKWGPAAICMLSVLTVCLAYHYRAPFHDHWDIVPYYQALQSGELAFDDLFTLHGNHWHASGYIVLLGLSLITGMAHGFESVASVAFAGLGFCALVRMLSRSLKLLNIAGAAAWVIGISAFFLFSLDQSANWLWGWQVAVFINLAGALWVIERLSYGPMTAGNALIAALCCAAAVYAFGTGWVLLPIGFALLVFRGAHTNGPGRAALLIWLGLSTLLLWHFVVALQDEAAAYTAGSLPNLMDIGTWVGLLHYALNFVASPIVRFARDSSLVAMSIGAGVLTWSIWTLRAADKQSVWKAVAPFLALAAFSFGSGLLTAIGRWESFGVQQAFVSRYISFGSLFWIAVFVLAIFAIAKTRHRSHKTIFALLGLLFVLKLGNIPSVVQKSIKISNQITQTTEQVAVAYPNVTAPDYAVLHSPAQDIDPHLATLAEYEVSFFADRPSRDEASSGDEGAP